MLMTTQKVRSNVKSLLTVFFDYNGVVYREFLPEAPTVNKEYYREVIRRLCEAIRKNARIFVAKQFLTAHTSLLNPGFPKQHSNRILATVFTGLGLNRLFRVPKTQKKTMKGREICHDRGD